MSRFGDFAVEEFMEKSENQLTMRKTLGHMKIVEEFLTSKGENRKIWCIPPVELDPLLAAFFINVRTKDGNEYEPTSIRGMLGSVERYMKRHNYGTSVVTGFPKAKAAMVAKQKQLKAQGKGNKPKTSSSLTGAEVDRLFQCNQLGIATPTSVLNTVWYNNTLHFGMRAATEHKAMLCGDAELKHDPELNCEFLEFHERATKTRTGENIRDNRACPPRMYATPEIPERCPIAAYKFYAARRPSSYSNPSDPFYIATVTNNTSPTLSEQWFIQGPVGINKIGALMKAMAEKAGIGADKMLTNTSVRKTLVQRMTDCNVPDNLQIYVTGHKRPESLNNYRQLANRHKKQISSLLTANSAMASATCSRASVFPGPAIASTSTATVRSIAPPSATVTGCEDESGIVSTQSETRSQIISTRTETRSQVEMSQSRNTVNSIGKHPSDSVFVGSTINGNVTINYNYYTGSVPGSVEKRRRIQDKRDSDTESEDL